MVALHSYPKGKLFPSSPKLLLLKTGTLFCAANARNTFETSIPKFPKIIATTSRSSPAYASRDDQGNNLQKRVLPDSFHLPLHPYQRNKTGQVTASGASAYAVAFFNFVIYGI